MNQYDEMVARRIQDQLNCTGITENAVIPKEKENYRPKTLVDRTLEYIDPTPNIYTLFMQFNEKFFWNTLLPVQVRWSARMTTCAGICSFHPRNKECIIALSTPLLKLRPRKDLIETLLHEMIHAYLFLTNNNKDRDGHGPVFQSHMHRINREAGTNITIYHDFHDEVRLYKQHWWRCNGPCQNRAPYFGTVRRAMNRAPGPNDLWWKEHQLTCGGQFIKIKEPEKPAAKKSTKGRASTGGVVAKPSNNNSILDWVKKNKDDKNVKNQVPPKDPSKVPYIQPPLADKNKKVNSVFNVSGDLKKLGNATNNVFGWGVGGPNSSSSSSNSTSKITPTKNGTTQLSFSGMLGGSGTGRSILLDKFSNNSTTNSNKVSTINKSSTKTDESKTNSPSTTRRSNTDNYLENSNALTVQCPNCNNLVDELKINDHLDICLLGLKDSVEPSTSNKKRKNEFDDVEPQKISKNEIACPLCDKIISSDLFNVHLDKCVQNDLSEEAKDSINLDDSGSSSINLQDSPHVCLICNKLLESGETLNEHLDECVASVFDDSETDANSPTSETEKASEIIVLDEYPCPVCMELVKESLMNEHLDTCIDK